MEPETLREVLLLWLGQQSWRLVLGSFPERKSPSSAVSIHRKSRNAANVYVRCTPGLAQHSDRRELGLAPPESKLDLSKSLNCSGTLGPECSREEPGGARDPPRGAAAVAGTAELAAGVG